MSLNLINSIEDFNRVYFNGYFMFFINYKCTIEVLEYYIENYDNIDWYNISSSQPLSKKFIMKYADKLYWYKLIQNDKTHISYDLLEKNIYHYNLYLVYNRSITKHLDNIDKIVNKYQVKYQIDKLEYELNK